MLQNLELIWQKDKLRFGCNNLGNDLSILGRHGLLKTNSYILHSLEVVFETLFSILRMVDNNGNKNQCSAAADPRNQPAIWLHIFLSPIKNSLQPIPLIPLKFTQYLQFTLLH